MERMGSVRGRPLVVGAAVVAVAGFGLAVPTAAAPAPSSTDVTLTSGGSVHSTWTIVNDAGTSNGLPAGGECPSPAVPGLAVEDAQYDSDGVNKTDAFDNGLVFFVNNREMVSPTSWNVQTDPAEPGLNRVLTSGATRLSGLDTTVEYRAMPHQQVLRSVVSLANPGRTSVVVPFVVATNFGSDSGTVIVGSSSGDTTLTDADRWLVTADDPTSPVDAVNTSVLAGPGPVAAAPHGSSTTVFDCSETDGVRTTFTVTIPAGSTRSLMFFNELSGANATAVSAAARFNSNPAATNELLTGLSEAQRASIVNWRLTQARQPDAQIRKLNSRQYLGDGVHNAKGKHQTVKTVVHKGDKRKFKVRVYNDKKTRGIFSAHGLSSGKGLRVRYFSRGHNVTAQMTSAPGLLFSRGSGKHLTIKVKVKVLHSAAKKSRKFAKVTAYGLGSGFDRVDAVRAVLLVR